MDIVNWSTYIFYICTAKYGMKTDQKDSGFMEQQAPITKKKNGIIHIFFLLQTLKWNYYTILSQ